MGWVPVPPAKDECGHDDVTASARISAGGQHHHQMRLEIYLSNEVQMWGIVKGHKQKEAPQTQLTARSYYHS